MTIITSQLKNTFLSPCEQKKIIGLLDKLSDEKLVNVKGVQLNGLRTRFTTLLSQLLEIGNPNSVSLWVRYFWESEITKALNNEFYYPSTIELDLTTYCNNSCFFCKEGLNKIRYDYPFQKLKKDLKEFSKIPEIKFIIYSGGGEPICYPKLAEVLAVTHQYGFDIYLSTNGGLLGQTNLPLQVFVDNVSILKFSLGAPTHQTYNAIHHSQESVMPGELNSVDYIFEQITKIIRLRNKNKRIIQVGRKSKRFPLVVIAMTVSIVNQKEIVEMAKRATASGVDELWLRPVITSNKSLVNIKEGLRQMKKAQRLFGNKIIIKTFNHRLNFGSEKEDYFSRCVCHPVVNPDGIMHQGSVTPCVFRRGNRADNYWLATGSPCQDSIVNIIESQDYARKIEDQNVNLHSIGSKKCPRCRKTLNNIFLDILSEASLDEQNTIREIILKLFPKTVESEMLKYLY